MTNSSRIIKVFRILQYAWLLVGIVSIIMAIYEIINHNIKDALMFVAFTIIAGVAFYFRRKTILRLEQEHSNS